MSNQVKDMTDELNIRMDISVHLTDVKRGDVTEFVNSEIIGFGTGELICILKSKKTGQLYDLRLTEREQ